VQANQSQAFSEPREERAPDGPEVAAYAQELLHELSVLAANAGLTFLAYLVSLAAEEAGYRREQTEDRATSD
jgi:hypothetical protein